MNFTKMHGAGNDYIYINGNGPTQDWGKLAKLMSDRHEGIGADGLILALPSEKASIRMRMFNTDGSEGAMCGNGIRCFVGYAFENNLTPPTRFPVDVETASGIITVTPIWHNGEMSGARVNMGHPILDPSMIPVTVPATESALNEPFNIPIEVGETILHIYCVSMGNPHAVLFMEESVSDFNLHKIGPLIENHPMFPDRTNFEIVNIISRDKLRMRVWERGSGITMACGTGACAAAVCARILDHTDDEVEVQLPGGSLKVNWPGSGDLILEGPVRKVYDGVWNI